MSSPVWAGAQPVSMISTNCGEADSSRLSSAPLGIAGARGVRA